MNSQSKEIEELETFIESQCKEDRFRIEKDLGSGFVKLRSSEAERRQAAQDIRCSEDIMIELLRNSRDAGAKNIYIATFKEGDNRSIVVIDDGSGIPESMRETIFEPRVTSKLDTAHMDRWGMHGRGMALYSVKVNSEEAKVIDSVEGKGSVIYVNVDTSCLTEKADQSTFPSFEIVDGKLNVRGPKNLIRTVCEFALEHRNELNVYIGSPTDIAASLYFFGISTTSATERAFSDDLVNMSPVKLLCYSSDSAQFAHLSESIGLEISERTARRIMTDRILPLNSVMDDVASSIDSKKTPISNKRRKANNRKISLANEDISLIEQAVKNAFADIANKYYLDENVVPNITIKDNKLIASIELIETE